MGRLKCPSYAPAAADFVIITTATVCNYHHLSFVQRTQSEFYIRILHELRAAPTYFRVGFYGASFPPFLQVLSHYVMELFAVNCFNSHLSDNPDYFICMNCYCPGLAIGYSKKPVGIAGIFPVIGAVSNTQAKNVNGTISN